MTVPTAERLFEVPFGLVSLKEILMPRPVDAEGYPMDEIVFGRFTNFAYFMGVLEQVPLTQRNLIGVEVMLGHAIEDMERYGLFVAARAARDVLKGLKGELPLDGNLDTYCVLARQALVQELESRVFVNVPPDVAKFYREPVKDWQEVIDRFPETISDIEEASRCYALGRYAASVFHSMQTLEHGLLALGVFMEINDPNSGFTAVANALKRVTAKKYDELTEFERANRAFFEQMDAAVQSIKNAWRNKVIHAQGRLAVMTADFSPAVTIEIYMATRAFMRRLATDMPKQGGKGWNPFRR